MIKVSTENSLQHYQWGDGCEGWNFVDAASLSVKQERMPPGASEVLHYHADAQQFFFILKGVAHFEVEGEVMTVNENEGLHIAAGRNTASATERKQLSNLFYRRSPQRPATGSIYHHEKD